MDKNIETRAQTTGCLWFMLIAGMAITTSELVGVLGNGVVSIIFIILVAGMVTSGFIWNWGRVGMPRENISASEKAKRDRLSQALQNLSDDQLQRLKERINSGAISDSELGYLLGESDLYQKPKR